LNDASISQLVLRIASDDVSPECLEAEIYRRLLPLAGARIAELGCGGAEHTRAIAELDSDLSISAYEVDSIQHEKNLNSPQLANVSFKLAGAQAIPEPDASYDIVMMFKSLHHVPEQSLGKALDEIHRVLKNGGLAYFSEPVFAGEFNDILRLFHDESQVRQAAFGAISAAVTHGQFELVEEIFFNAPVRFADFAEFERKVINSTHSEFQLSPAVASEVRSRMEARMTDSGIHFSTPMRIDLLRKPV
jgi:SAM-dependent methyltransferase